ncbi:MAG TPA: PAS domain-containing sensor histidine kinase [Candidatus Dormibacteraeota bacterium]|nr:PAS domain-containing sensor histidine kinase [Candidatus Dormibacteraeota bacterium]
MQNASAVALSRRPTAVRGLGISGWRPFAIAAAAVAVVSVLFTAWTAFHWISDQATIDFDDIGEAVAAFIAAASCSFAAARNTGRTRVAWTLFAASTFSWAVGEVIWSVYEVGLGVAVPFPSAADAGFLLAVPFAIAGVFAFTSAPTRLATKGQTVLSGAIVALALLFIAWEVGLAKVYETSPATPVAQAIGLAYPIGDIITATVLVVALQRARKGEVGRLMLLLGGLAFTALSDSAFAYLTANGTYSAIGSVLDSGWVMGFLLIALAPLWPAGESRQHAEEGPIQLWQLALPWIAVLLGAIVVIERAVTDQSLDRFATVLAGSLGVLFVASHVLSHRDSLDLLHRSRTQEGQVERRNQLLSEILTHAPLGIARAGVDMNIIDVNPRMAALLRTTPEKMVGTPVANYLHPDEFARVFEVFQPLWKGVVPSIESDTRAIRTDGTEVWLHWSATSVRNAAGRIAYFLVMYEDTDAEHAANEAAAAHLAGLERLNQLKSEFVSLVSHEFRTALVGISGFSEMIRDEEVNLDEAKAYAGDINKEAERLNRMINDMLDLDRIEAGRLTLHIDSVDLNDLLSSAAERVRAGSEHHWVTCKFEGDPIVRCDPDRVAQVALNLLSNAVKYSPDGGDVTITTALRNGEVQVSIRDHGVGIAPEFMQKLFSRYERYEKTSGKIIGTGLGLALAKQIVEMHGGTIAVTSEPGEGSDFHFTLPVNGPKIG